MNTVPSCSLVVPALAGHAFVAARVTYVAPELSDVAVDLARKLSGMPAASAVTAEPSPVGYEPTAGDILLTLVNGTPESYRITRSAAPAYSTVAITGADLAGLFYGTRTLLQLLTTKAPLPNQIDDAPAYAHRGLMLDCGRKYFTPQWIKQLISELAARKLNYLQLHLSEGIGFRVESAAYPHLMSPEYLTKTEIREIIDFAAAHHVAIVPDFDSPGHLEYVLRDYPEYQLTLADGTLHSGHLDYSNPEARAFIGTIVAELCETFTGCQHFHLGGDEYFPAPWQGTGNDVVTAATAPQLVAYAQSVAGSDATIFDGYLHYLNELSDIVARHGMTARVWNDDIHPSATRLRPGTEVDCWIRWNTDAPHAGDLAAAGYPLLNANGDYLYFIVTGEGLGTGPHKHPAGIYESWTPRTFMGAAGSAGDYELPAAYPLLGAHLSVWCDTPDGMTQTEIASALTPWLNAFSQHMWSGTRSVATYREFEHLAATLGLGAAAPSATE